MENTIKTKRIAEYKSLYHNKDAVMVYCDIRGIQISGAICHRDDFKFKGEAYVFKKLLLLITNEDNDGGKLYELYNVHLPIAHTVVRDVN
jgi:hypothetical protein